MVRPAGYETSDVRPLHVAIAALSFALSLIVIAAAMWGLRGFLESRAVIGPIRTDVERIARIPPPPRLQIDEAEELNVIERAADMDLHSLEWIDRSGGIAHIPIEDAMHLLAEQGWPSRRTSP